MDNITQGKITVASVSNAVRASKIYGSLNLKSLYLLDVIGGLLTRYPNLDFKQQRQLRSLYTIIQHNNSDICNDKKQDFKSYKNLGCGNSGIINNITLSQISEIPTVENNEAIIIDNYTFNYNDFTKQFTDPQNGIPEFVRLTSLPSVGLLQYNGNNIELGFEFNLLNISNLVYIIQNTTSPITDVINFQTSNNNINKTFSNMANFTFTINAAVNQPPTTVGNNFKTIDNGSTYVFTVADFTTGTTPAYSDPEGDAASMLKIDSLPVDGDLQFNGSAVTVNQTIPFQGAVSISSGSFRYVSEQNSPEADVETFNFQISDTGSGQFTS